MIAGIVASAFGAGGGGAPTALAEFNFSLDTYTIDGVSVNVYEQIQNPYSTFETVAQDGTGYYGYTAGLTFAAEAIADFLALLIAPGEQRTLVMLVSFPNATGGTNPRFTIRTDGGSNPFEFYVEQNVGGSGGSTTDLEISAVDTDAGTPATDSVTGWSTSTTFAVALRYDGTNFSICHSGEAPVTQSMGTPAAFDDGAFVLEFTGAITVGFFEYTPRLRKLTIYGPTTDEQMSALTV